VRTIDAQVADFAGLLAWRHSAGLGLPAAVPCLSTKHRNSGACPTSSALQSRSGDGFASVFQRAISGHGLLVFLFLAAFGWGALHALSPGHGKAMVAAYLVGTRGTARHAAALGAIVTVTHTAGVFALGLVTRLAMRPIAGYSRGHNLAGGRQRRQCHCRRAVFRGRHGALPSRAH